MRILKNRICAICGCKFDVKLEPGNRIPIQYFYSKELGKTLTGEENCPLCRAWKYFDYLFEID